MPYDAEEAYGERAAGFEDMRRRVPDASKLFAYTASSRASAWIRHCAKSSITSCSASSSIRDVTCHLSCH